MIQNLLSSYAIISITKKIDALKDKNMIDPEEIKNAPKIFEPAKEEIELNFEMEEITTD